MIIDDSPKTNDAGGNDQVVRNMMEAKLRLGIANNVVVYGLGEEEEIATQVSNLFEDLGLQKLSNDKVMNGYKAERIGQAKVGGNRPVRLKLDKEMKKELMRRKRVLNEFEQYKNRVWINHDETSAQRHAKYLERAAKREGGSITEESGDEENEQENEGLVNGQRAIHQTISGH